MVVQNSIEIDDNGSDDGYNRKKLVIIVTDRNVINDKRIFLEFNSLDDFLSFKHKIKAFLEELDISEAYYRDRLSEDK